MSTMSPSNITTRELLNLGMQITPAGPVKPVCVVVITTHQVTGKREVTSEGEVAELFSSLATKERDNGRCFAFGERIFDEIIDDLRIVVEVL